MAGTGVSGLDDILNGGLAAGRLFLMEGSPGTGKTTMAMRFLMEGAVKGEKTLYITLSETEQELRMSAASYGWTFAESVKIFELAPPESLLDADQQQSLLYSSDLELGETTKLIFETVEQSGATRIVLDSLSEIRLLAQSSLRYRRQVLALKHYFARRGATVLMLDDLTAEALDKTVHSIAHGVIRLEELAPDYGPERRRLRVVKYRAQSFRGGYHDFVIRNDGASVFPRLVSGEHRRAFKRNRLGTGVAGLDALLGGGIEQGSSTLLLGPAGSGKSVLTLQFVKAALERGDKAAMFIFDEELGLLFDRAKPLGYDLQAWRESGKLSITQLDAAELSPGEFAHRVRAGVERA
jgi:circadian clock protein KaiC